MTDDYSDPKTNIGNQPSRSPWKSGWLRWLAAGHRRRGEGNRRSLGAACGVPLPALSQELGVTVQQVRPRKQTVQDRVQAAIRQLADEGTLHRAIKVPASIGNVDLVADLRTRLITTSVTADAPTDKKRPIARINWLLRQLKDAPDDLRIDVRFASTKATTSELLGNCREHPESLLNPDDPKRDPRSFTLARCLPMGKKGGLDKGSFAFEMRRQVTDFYRDIVQDLTPPVAKVPQLPEKEKTSASPTSEAAERRTQEDGLRDIAGLGDLGLDIFGG